MKNTRKARPSDRVTDNTEEFRYAMHKRQAMKQLIPLDYLRAARLQKVRRYTLAQRILITLIAALVAVLVILYAR